jgi:hypothetical protein
MHEGVKAIRRALKARDAAEVARAEMIEQLPALMKALRGSKPQWQFAEELGVSPMAIAKVESRQRLAIGRPTLERLIEMSRKIEQ